MSARATTIELNGKRYDTRTGALISEVKAPVQNSATHAPISAQPKTQPQVMDGVRRVVRTHSPVHHSRQADKSKALMRSAVKKPVHAHATPPVTKHEVARHEIDPKRAHRANTVSKSNLVSKFGSTKPSAVTPQASVLPVRPAPDAPPAPLFSAHKQADVAGSGAHKAMFQHAVEKASHHTQPKQPARRSHRVARRLKMSPRTLNVAAGSMAALLLIGFVAFQNVTSIKMQVATARSGVEGRLPSYQPSGFSLASNINYKPGEITLAYQSRSDDRQFMVSQRSSQWSSDSLLEQYVAPNKQDYQTFEENGKTVYVYDKSNATWVDGGVWYQIEGNAELTQDQLMRVASSL